MFRHQCMFLCIAGASCVHISRTSASQRCNSVVNFVTSAAKHRGKATERGKLTGELRLARETQATGT